MKDFVYATVPRPRTVAELKAKILQAPPHVTGAPIRKAFLHGKRRAEGCIRNGGGGWKGY